MAIDVDVSGAMNSATMTVTVRPRRVWLLKLRCMVGMFLIVAGARTMGVGTINLEHGEPE